MRRWIPFGFLIALILLAARPLWELSFYYSDDGLLRLAHALSLDQMIHQGIVYPRWLNDLAFGLGYPLFNYYPPLSTYLIESFHLVGFDFVTALKIAFGAMIVIAACGAYALGAEIFRDEKNARALGILTAVAYVCFPYLLADIYTRGVSTEALGLVLLPWVIWALHRAITTTSLGAIILGAIFLALLILAHILTLGIVAPVLAAYLVLVIASEAKQSLGPLRAERSNPQLANWTLLQAHLPWRMVPGKIVLAMSYRVILTMTLAAGLSAFYWFPFIAELSLVRIGRGGVPIGAVFPDHFMKLSDLVQSSGFYQYAPAPFALGLVPILFSAFAFVITLIARKHIRPRAMIIFFGVVAFVAALAMSEPTRDLWLAVPFTIMIQYPWRVSVLINLSAAIVISALALVPHQFNLPRQLDANVVQFTLIALIACGLIFAGLGHLAPQEIFLPTDAPTLAQIARFEAYSKFIGATTWGEYLPATFRVANLATYRAPQTNAPRATIALTRYDAARREMAVSASQPFSVSLRAFYFPDWRATIDDQPAAAYSSTAMGLLTVDVPAGDHHVTFVQNDTPPRQIGGWISMSSLIALIGLTALALRRRESDVRAVLAAYVIVGALIAPMALTAFTASPPALQATRISVTPALEMIGLRVENAQRQADTWRVSEPTQSLHLRVYWHIQASVQDKSLTWRLVDDAGKVWALREQLPRYGTGYAGSWVANEIVEDMYDLPIAAIAPGQFHLQVSFGDAHEFIPVGVIEFARGAAPSSTAPRITNQVNARVGQKIRLLGYDAPEKLVPGSRFLLTLFWQTDENVYDDYTAFIQLLDAKGNALLKYDSVPGSGLSSLFLWIPGETVVDRVVLNLPNALPAGKYTVIVGMYHYPELERLPVTSQTGELSPDDVVELGSFEIGNRE
jgi:hypothetical protein